MFKINYLSRDAAFSLFLKFRNVFDAAIRLLHKAGPTSIIHAIGIPSNGFEMLHRRGGGRTTVFLLFALEERFGFVVRHIASCEFGLQIGKGVVGENRSGGKNCCDQGKWNNSGKVHEASFRQRMHSVNLARQEPNALQLVILSVVR